MRQAYSHGTGTSGEPSKQISAFSSHTTVTRYTRLPLQKKDDHPCLPRRRKIFTCSSVQLCWLLSGLRGPVRLAPCFSGQLRLPLTGDGSLILRATASPQEQECFGCSWEGVKSSVPVSQHKMAFSKVSASSVWGESSTVNDNIRSISFPWRVLLAHFSNNLHSLFSHLLVSSSLWKIFVLHSTLVQHSLKRCWNEAVKPSRSSERRYHKHSFVLISDLRFTMDCQLPI